jgi:hypothetical protein
MFLVHLAALWNERMKFLGLVFSFGNYSLSVYMHDKAINARSFDLDHEAWVMLLGFLEDLCNVTIIAKGVSTFGILVH